MTAQVTSGAAADLSVADFRSRGTGARAVALASHESQPLANQATCIEAVADAKRRLTADPDLVAPSWRAYAVAANTVEFWQADNDRQHIRVQYHRHQDGWTHNLLWP